MCQEWGRLTQGYKDIKGTNTGCFIPKSAIPKDRKTTYCRIVTADRPRKTQPRRCRATVGGDRIDYPWEVTTKTSNLVTCKVLFNDVISTKDGRFLTIDIKDFFLNNMLPRKEYMKIHLDTIPNAIRELYKLDEMATDGFIYFEVSKGMYGLPQAGRVANDTLIPRLEAAGYYQSNRVPGLFLHCTNSVKFSLIVDDFGVRYIDKADAQHLIATLSADYPITVDWTGSNYCRINLDWHYDEGYVDISMQGYVKRALQ